MAHKIRQKDGMITCPCQASHHPRRIVLTGGPGAGKTAVLELVRQYFCQHVDVLPEAASILFSGGFRRGATPDSQRALQRAIFHVQHALETVADAENNKVIVLCDRGSIDGMAYWVGTEDYWTAMHTTRDKEYARYDVVIHLRTPTQDGGYNQRNPARVESALQARVIDEKIMEAWADHPKRAIVDNRPSFIEKAQTVLELLHHLLPDCCKQFVPPPTGQFNAHSSTGTSS